MLSIGISEIIVAGIVALMVLRPGDYSAIIKTYKLLYKKLGELRKEFFGLADNVTKTIEKSSKITGDDGKEYDFFSLEEVEKMIQKTETQKTARQEINNDQK